MTPSTAVVVIGRNEGKRLIRCLQSVTGRASVVVYVDSGSTDGSVESARNLGVDVVELNMSQPFTAARARNEGLDRALELDGTISFVQFVDGDCEVRSDWLGIAADHLSAHPDVAVVCGRRRETLPSESPYNRVIDLEWDTPIGEATSCGGDAMMRVDRLVAIGGYNEEMIAGEEPELCYRLRRAGHRIIRLDAEMTLHDAKVLRFGQWWRRNVRAGHAYAEAAYRHGSEAEHVAVRDVCSTIFWAAVLPITALAAWPSTGGASLLLVASYPLLVTRIYRFCRARQRGASESALYAALCVVGKAPELQGILEFVWNRLIRRKTRALIEYKQA